MDDMLSYYETFDEEGRLARGAGPLEFARAQELIKRFLPPPPAVVLDVGGGPGAYSLWLAREGYEVHLMDPTPKHLDQAMSASESQPDHPISSVTEGDARSLLWGDSSCDAVLLMGPLYHLTEREDRLLALSEARRVLRPGRPVFAVGVNRFASLLDGLRRGLIDDPDFVKILERDLLDGQHRSPKTGIDYWTTAIMHRPEQLEQEVRDAGFTIDGVLPVQGPGWLAKDFEARWEDPLRREQLLGLVRAVEREPTLLGISGHFMVIGTKPE